MSLSIALLNIARRYLNIRPPRCQAMQRVIGKGIGLDWEVVGFWFWRCNVQRRDNDGLLTNRTLFAARTRCRDAIYRVSTDDRTAADVRFLGNAILTRLYRSTE